MIAKGFVFVFLTSKLLDSLPTMYRRDRFPKLPDRSSWLKIPTCHLIGISCFKLSGGEKATQCPRNLTPHGVSPITTDSTSEPRSLIQAVLDSVN